jgi:hypothetical protein
MDSLTMATGKDIATARRGHFTGHGSTFPPPGNLSGLVPYGVLEMMICGKSAYLKTILLSPDIPCWALTCYRLAGSSSVDVRKNDLLRPGCRNGVAGAELHKEGCFCDLRIFVRSKRSSSLIIM